MADVVALNPERLLWASGLQAVSEVTLLWSLRWPDLRELHNHTEDLAHSCRAREQAER